jgi:pyrroloquinoline-quinone synthase
LKCLDHAIAEKHLLKHPFYEDWQKGVITRLSLQTYASQYYRLVAAFPDFLLTLAMRTGDELRDIVLENLEEELNIDRPHPKLWRDFAAALGVSDGSLVDTVSMPATQALIGLFEGICRDRPVTEAVAALYAYEAQVPEIADKKIAGLRKFYGVTEAKGLAYFTVHREADKVHRAAWRAWLEKSAERGWADTAATIETATDVLGALWAFLDSVREAPGETEVPAV